MAYKILKMNTTSGVVYTLNSVEKNSWGDEYIPSRPVKYYKTIAGAKREAIKRGFRLVN